MKVIIHAGLHKTGTSTVQAYWSHHFGERGRTWYPRPIVNGPGHAAVAWWAQERTDVDATQPLPRIREVAEEAGCETLLLSSEEFDMSGTLTLQRLRELFADDELVLLITLTPPLHRWPSGWQELVKHGLALDQVDSRPEVDEFTRLGRRSFKELAEDLGADRTLLRLVRPEPLEEDLARDLLRAVGVDVSDLTEEAEPTHNQSLGDVEIHLVRALNELVPDGLLAAPAQALVDALRNSSAWRGSVPRRHVRIDPRMRSHVVGRAGVEQAGLSEAQSRQGVELLDPHGLHDSWDTWEPEG